MLARRATDSEHRAMEYTREVLQQMIDDGIEESDQLDYKRAGAFDRRNTKSVDQITKDVSAFANASGGRIIYGIGEFADVTRSHLPEDFFPVDRTQYSREWLSGIIEQIRPRIEGLRIYPVHVGPGANDHCYVVRFPRATRLTKRVTTSIIGGAISNRRQCRTTKFAK